MPATLDQILTETRARVEARKREVSLEEIAEQAERTRGSVGRLRQALTDSARRRGIAVIAELKKASPSRGMIRGTFPVGQLARDLKEAGASALSVLTEEEHFQGSLVYLREAAAATDLPC